MSKYPNGLPDLEPAKRCPFCLNKMEPSRNTGYQHPRNPECIISGWFIGAANVKKWNKRRGRLDLYMTVVDGHPQFNRDGVGNPVKCDMINNTIAYYRGTYNENVDG